MSENKKPFEIETPGELLRAILFVLGSIVFSGVLVLLACKIIIDIVIALSYTSLVGIIIGSFIIATASVIGSPIQEEMIKYYEEKNKKYLEEKKKKEDDKDVQTNSKS